MEIFFQPADIFHLKYSSIQIISKGLRKYTGRDRVTENLIQPCLVNESDIAPPGGMLLYFSLLAHLTNRSLK